MCHAEPSPPMQRIAPGPTKDPLDLRHSITAPTERQGAANPYFGISPAGDLEHDVPAQRPPVALAVDSVSITNQRFPYRVTDPLFHEATVLCDLEAGCALPAAQRGIHMSRIEQALATAEAATTLPGVALLLADQVAARQAQTDAFASLTGDVVLKIPTSITGLPSRDRVTIGARAHAGASIAVNVTATTMTACPCMQAYALDDLLAHFGALDGETAGPQGEPSTAARAAVRAAVPVATHSQKGTVTISISLPLDGPVPAEATGPEFDRFVQEAGLPTYADLWTMADAGTTLTRELLKRPDEYDMVKRAHRRAQFVEDVVRDTCSVAAQRLTSVPDSATLTVRAASFESIHGHDIQAGLTITLHCLRAALA